MTVRLESIGDLDDEFDRIIEKVKDIRDNRDWDCDGLASMAHELRHLGDHLGELGYALRGIAIEGGLGAEK